MTNYQKRKEKNDEYRSKIMRFTFQLSLGDGEVRDWFEQQPEKGAYLKDLILRDKAERLGYREQKSAEPDKAGDYEIIQSIRMGGRVLLMGFNPKDETYMTCYQQYSFLGETIYPEAVASKDYLEIANTFIERLQMQLEKAKEFRAARNIPQVVLGAEDCLPQSEESFQGKLIVVRSSSLAPEYRTADCQLGFAISGFGCTPGSRGCAVFFQELYFGISIECEVIDADHTWQAVMVADVVDMSFKMGNAFFKCREIFLAQIRQIDTAVVFEGTNSDNDNGAVGAQSGFPANDIDKFLCPQIGAETAFGDYVIGQFQC